MITMDQGQVEPLLNNNLVGSLGRAANWSNLGPGTIGGGSNEQEENDYLKEYRIEIESYEQALTYGFKLNIELPNGQQLSNEFYQRAVSHIGQRLRGRTANIHVEAGLLLRSKINGILRYWYPGALSSILSGLVNDGNDVNSLRAP